MPDDGAQSGNDKPTPVDFENESERTNEKNRLKTTVSNLYNGLVNVTVVTAIGDLAIEISTQEGNERIDVKIPAQKPAFQSFITQFDLVEGDILTTLPSDYEKYPTVQELHERNVLTATKVLPENITALVNAGREVIRLFGA